MGIMKRWIRRQLAGWLLLLFAVAAVGSPQQATNSSQQTEGVSSIPSNTQESSTSDKKLGAVPADPETLPDSPSSVRSQTIADNRQESNQQSSQSEQNTSQQPVGTAAAQSLKTTGVAASQPAGAAIAPAQQRRARSVLIKVGLIVGAGVAVGSVVALSSASPSRPH